MNAPLFKPGDRALCAHSGGSSGQLQIGTLYYVEEVSPVREGEHQHLLLLGREFKGEGWLADRFERVPVTERVKP